MSKTKQYLQQVYWAHKHIEHLEMEIKDLEAEITSVSAIDYSKDRVDSSDMSSSVENAVVKLTRYKEKLEKEKFDYTELKLRITKEIDMVEDPTYRQILYLRYIKFLNWERISEVIYYHEKYVFKLHNKAIKAFKDKL